MKKIKYLLIAFALFLCFPFVVNADHIYNLDMNINLDKEGNGLVTEKWTVKANSGSEWYKAMNNIGNMKISNFTVEMDGKLLKYKEWDIDESLNEKKGYYGINDTSEGIELCFGKYDMKRHTFTLKYNLSNMIFNTDDSQILYNTLFPNVTADNFKVTISGFYNYPDTLDVWGYGYKGYAYVKNGKIEMSNEENTKLEDDYVTLLVKFPENTFETSNRYSEYNTFEDVYNQAKEGTFEYDYDTENDKTSIFETIVYFLIDFLAPFGIIIIPLVIGVITVKNSSYGYTGNKKITKENTPMFRDIPCNKDIHYANALININKFGYKESNIFGAIILKWVKEDKIKFIKGETGIFKKETGMIDLRNNAEFDNENEKDLFALMRAASGDGILEAKELEKWCRRNYSKFFDLFERIKKDEINRLKSENHIYKRTNKEECKKRTVMDDEIYEDSKKLFGLKLYLQEFSRIDTKEVMEVKIWDEYLMFAYLFGMADKVASQLKNLYPEVLENPDINGRYIDYNTITFIDHISTRGFSAASSARSAAESYSSGGGGFSSGGGGGGSFGGGGSMGGR